MPISTLQQHAFAGAEAFRGQVDTEVKKQALDLAEAPGRDDRQREVLARVVKNPDIYNFAATIVADYDWTNTFDPWAADPLTVAGAIQTFVTKWFSLLTGYIPTPPPPEP